MKDLPNKENILQGLYMSIKLTKILPLLYIYLVALIIVYKEHWNCPNRYTKLQIFTKTKCAYYNLDTHLGWDRETKGSEREVQPCVNSWKSWARNCVYSNASQVWSFGPLPLSSAQNTISHHPGLDPKTSLALKRSSGVYRTTLPLVLNRTWHDPIVFLH